MATVAREVDPMHLEGTALGGQSHHAADQRRLKRGDTVIANGQRGTIVRVAADESWADVEFPGPNGTVVSRRVMNPRGLVVLNTSR